MWTSSTLVDTPIEASVALACPIMEVGDIEPGMKGTGKTVFHGTEPEDFDVEVIAVLKGAGKLSDLVLIRASGQAIEAAGGIAEGMSGSPVYIDGRLLGAISYVFAGSDHFMGMVTPISDMLRILSYPDSTGASLVKGTVGMTDRLWLDGALNAAVTPVSVSGLSGRSLERISQSLQQYGLTVRPSVSVGSAKGRISVGSNSTVPSGVPDRGIPHIVPGSTVGVQLAKGDVDITAFGTVTYVDGDAFLAFGHPLLGRGASALSACSASVQGIIKSESTPFKVLAPGATVGVITQDRLNGIGGRLGQADAYVPVSIRVVDKETGRNRQISTFIAPDESLIADIFGAAALAAMDGVTDRMGLGTANVSLKIKMAGHDPYERANTFFSPSDVAGMSVGEPYDTLWLVANNAAEKVEIEGIEMYVEVEPVRRTAMIESVRVMEPTVRPGEAVNVSVTLRQHRGGRVTKMMSVVVPEDAPGGVLSMCVRGGNVSIFDEGDYVYDSMSMEGVLYMEVDDVMAKIASMPRGNELVLELEPYLFEEEEHGSVVSPSLESHRDDLRDMGAKEKDQKTTASTGAYEESSDKPTIARMETDWVIEGIKWVTIEVETRDEEMEWCEGSEI